METKHTTGSYLSAEQVRQLNEKHGWFQYGDAQSDVSREFAQDAIATYECMRAAAPDLLAALSALYGALDSCVELTPTLMQQARAAIAKATGQPCTAT